MKNFELLFDLIPTHPALNIALIEDSTYPCAHKLIEFSKKIDASLYIKNPNPNSYEKSDTLHVEDFDFKQDKYNKHSLQYDFLFLCAKIDDIEDIPSTCKKIYRAIKNAAQIYIAVEKDKIKDLSSTLENVNFVALNTIELNENIDIISAKKMHGWTKV